MKALVVGLDGATFAVLGPLMKSGYMPHLRRALSRGVSSDLLSTVPSITALAWPSFMTGKDPGKHGVLGWQERLNAGFERPWISGNRIAGSKLWHLVGQAGMRTCVVNVPMTYPPESLDGAMVTGMLTPGLEVQFTHPPELQAELLSSVPEYQIDVDVQNTRRDTRSLSAVRGLLEETAKATRARGKAIRWLLERECPDLAVAVFELPD